MIIFFTVDLMVIVFMLFGAVGLAYEIMSVLSAIWWAIGIFAIPIGVIVICIKKLKIALGYSDEQGERANCIYIPIYLVAGVTSVLFFQSTTICLWLISLTASKELSILLLKLYNDGAIGISSSNLGLRVRKLD